MNQFLQKAISFIIQFLMCFFTPACFIAGITVAFLCGWFEYEVLKSLLPQKFEPAIFYAVIAFESMKCLLVFLKYANPRDSRYSFTKTRSALISISLVCTMIFCFHSLYKPNEKEIRVKKIEQQRVFYETEVAQINEAFDKETANITAHYKALIAEQIRLREKEKLNTFGPSKQFIGNRYRAYQAEIERLEDKLSTEIKDVQTRRKIALKEVSDAFHTNVKKAEKEAQSTLSSGSPVLLSVIGIINFNREPKEEQYILLVGILSLLLTIILESVIMVSFSVLAFQHGQDFNLQQQRRNMNSTQKINQEILKEVLKNSQKLSNEFLDAAIKNSKEVAQKIGRTIKENINNLFKNKSL